VPSKSAGILNILSLKNTLIAHLPSPNVTWYFHGKGKYQHLLLSTYTLFIGLWSRRSADAWRPLGYIANETVYFSGSERKQHSANGKSQRLHQLLDCILESFQAAKLPGALSNTKIRLGRKEKVVNLYVPLQFIIGDVEGGDQLCSCWSYCLKTCQRMCRTCNVSTLTCNKTTIRCKCIEVAKITALNQHQDKAALKKLCQ
jgi:hypothetical protein